MRRESPASSLAGIAEAGARLVALVLVMLVSAFVVLPVQGWLARRAPLKAAWVAARFGRTVLWLCRVKLQVFGRLQPGACLVAANHVSWLDIPAFAAIHPFCFLAKREVASWPLVSRIAAVQGTVFVDRSRRRELIGANRALAERLRAGRAVLLFPEGTTTADPFPLQFKTPHFQAPPLAAGAGMGATIAVQPAAIVYSAAHAPWIGDDNLLQHLWRVLRERPMVCTVRFGPPSRIRFGDNRKEIGRAALAGVVQLLAAAAGDRARDDAPTSAFPGIGQDAA